MIASTQITHIEISLSYLKLLSRKILFINRKIESINMQATLAKRKFHGTITAKL